MNILNKIDDDALIEYLTVCGKFSSIDTEKAASLARIAKRYYAGDASQRDKMKALMRFEKRWYDSLKAGKPDYSIYAHPYYLTDVWACWCVYSRNYIRSLIKPKGYNKESGESLLNYFAKKFGDRLSVCDLGCGFGYTTAALREIFKKGSIVYGTQLKRTMQWKLAKYFSLKYNYFVLDRAVLKAEILFASEYFEHFEKPIKHLQEVLSYVDPKVLVLANAFNTRSVGHFLTYEHNNEKIGQKYISRAFNKHLKDQGFVKLKTNLWNSRPAIWVKE